MRGGTHKKKDIKTGQQALLDVLFSNRSINKTIIKELGVHKQNLINWRNRGGVPIKFCFRLASILHTEPLALNYKAWSTTMPQDAVPAWKEVVKHCPISGTSIKAILKLG